MIRLEIIIPCIIALATMATGWVTMYHRPYNFYPHVIVAAGQALAFAAVIYGLHVLNIFA